MIRLIHLIVIPHKEKRTFHKIAFLLLLKYLNDTEYFFLSSFHPVWPVRAIKKKIQVSVKMPHVNSWETYQVKQEDWKPGVLKLIPFTWKNKKLRLLRKSNGSCHSQKLQKIMDCDLGWWNFPTLFNMNVLIEDAIYPSPSGDGTAILHGHPSRKGLAACRAKAVPAFLRYF